VYRAVGWQAVVGVYEPGVRVAYGAAFGEDGGQIPQAAGRVHRNHASVYDVAFRLPPHGRSTSLAEASARRPDHRLSSSAGRTARPAAFAGVHDVAVTPR
jgi:hypothetical protein